MAAFQSFSPAGSSISPKKTSTMQRLRMLSSKPRGEDLRVLRELLEAGKLTPAIGRTYPLVEGHAGGKIVISPVG